VSHLTPKNLLLFLRQFIDDLEVHRVLKHHGKKGEGWFSEGGKGVGVLCCSFCKALFICFFPSTFALYRLSLSSKPIPQENIKAEELT